MPTTMSLFHHRTVLLASTATPKQDKRSRKCNARVELDSAHQIKTEWKALIVQSLPKQ